MILRSLQASVAEFESLSGWELTERGACRGDVCIPLTAGTVGDFVDIARLADDLAMPLVNDKKHGIWSLGPTSGGRALTSAVAPPLVLPDIRSGTFELASLLGQKVLLIAWASW